MEECEDFLRSWGKGAFALSSRYGAESISPSLSPTGKYVSLSPFHVRLDGGDSAEGEASVVIDVSIVWQESYRVPELWFTASTESGEFPPLESIQGFISRNYRGAYCGDGTIAPSKDCTCMEGDLLTSCEWHPITKVPSFCVHSCGTSKALSELASLKPSLLGWLSSNLPLIGASAHVC